MRPRLLLCSLILSMAPVLGITATNRPPAAPRITYGGTRRALPGTIQAEDFDTGGEGVTYHDTTAGNRGGVYRQTSVDLEATVDTSFGYNVGWIAPGEWLAYSVDVRQSGS
jgi:hypothetical protein